MIKYDKDMYMGYFCLHAIKLNTIEDIDKARYKARQSLFIGNSDKSNYRAEIKALYALKKEMIKHNKDKERWFNAGQVM